MHHDVRPVNPGDPTASRRARMIGALAGALFFVAFGSVCSGQADGAPAAPEPGAGGPDAAEARADADAAADAAGADGQADGGGQTPVEISNYDTVTLSVRETPLSQVLELLSIQGQRNIVPSPRVSGTVTANLYDVTFEQALEAILQQNGAGFVRKGDFIYVYTQDELQKIREAQRHLETRVFRLNYLTASDASTFVTPMLSSAGSIAVSGDVESGFQPSVGDGGANSSAHVDTMVVHDYEEKLERIAKVVKSLDVRPRQVLVEATILEARIEEDNKFGVDFSILTNAAVQSLANPLNGAGELIAGTLKPANKAGALQSSVGNVNTADGGFTGGAVTDNVAIFIQALDSITDTTIIANPKVLALNRQRADVLIGEKLGYVSTTSTSTSTTQSVEFLDTGIQLTARPFISDDGFIRLELKPQVSTGSVTVSTNFTIPNETTNELTTNVMVRDGQTIVLGGLFKEETTVQREQVPGLASVPLAGEAFKGRSDDIDRTEIIFLITPHIVKDEALEAAGQAAADGIEMIRLGVREGLLPWSRTKMTAAHLRDALEAVEAGDDAKALWKVDLALGMQPNQPEAIRLKEKLTGRRVYHPRLSVLNQAVDLLVERTTERRRPPRPVEPDPGPTRPDEHVPAPTRPAPGSPLPEDGDVIGDPDDEGADAADDADDNEGAPTDGGETGRSARTGEPDTDENRSDA